MYTYNDKNVKEPYKQPDKHVRFSNTVENFGGDSKCPQWLWIVLAVVAGLLVVLLVVMLVMRARKHGGSKSPHSGEFGFRFY